jgi:hypothetical protein
MTTIRVVTDCALPAQEVLRAVRDFSARREDVFPAVHMDRLELHSQEGDSADATEGTPVGPLGSNWERCDYDWSKPDAVTATVTDSNVYAVPGSRWELRATPTDDGSEVEMTWVREFRTSPRGLLFGTLFRLIGRPIFRRYAGEIIENLEQLER